MRPERVFDSIRSYNSAMEKLTRRALLGSVVAAPAVAALADVPAGHPNLKLHPMTFAPPAEAERRLSEHVERRERTYIVATAGRNHNGRDYSRVLELMGKQAKGRLVVVDDAVYGVVEDYWLRCETLRCNLKLSADRTLSHEYSALRVVVRWFREPPEGWQIVPVGVAKKPSTDDGVVNLDYYLECFHIVRESAFEGATRISRCNFDRCFTDLKSASAIRMRERRVIA